MLLYQQSVKLWNDVMTFIHSEPKRQFRSQVRQEMLHVDNIYTVFSKSGKMKLIELCECLLEVYFKNIIDETVLLVNSWSPFKNKDLADSVKLLNKIIHVFVMTSKMTHLIQAFQRYGFQVWEKFH